MTFERLEAWRLKEGQTIQQACKRLGISWDRWDAIRKSGMVPLVVRLAWLAVYHRLDEETL